MLKLERLEVSGFKSFVDPVAVEFAGGITGIVGPNGCGKSNLADAITWVLGEQSAKSLRGETMEDVIFNGSERRKPLGMGEVQVIFRTDPGFEYAEEGRLTISRRVFRTGESQYRLNGKVVRLKEIKDLLMDTGLGIRAYSVIEQGKIGLILSGKPQERRKLIEEAAGVTRYKARKKVAEVKLEEASANLLRLDDIVAEVERNLRSLKRQAGAARRYQERQGEARSLLREVLLGRWAALAGTLAAQRGVLGGAEEREAELVAELHRREAELARRRDALDARLNALAETARRQAELERTIEGHQQFLVGGRRTREEIDGQRRAGSAGALRRSDSIGALEAAAAEVRASREVVVGEHDAAAARVEADGETLRRVEQQATAAEQQIEEARRELLASMGGLAALRDEIHRREIEREKGQFRRRHLVEELAERRSELAEACGERDAAAARLTELLAALPGWAERRDLATAELERLLGEEAEATQRLRLLEGESAAAQARQGFLVELASAAGERRSELVERLREAGVAEPRFLGERLTPFRGYEATLDLYLGQLTDAVVLAHGASGLDLARALVARGGLVGTLLAPNDATRAFPAPADPDVVATLGEALGLPESTARALPPAFLVRTAAAAERLAHRHPGAAFLAPDRIWAHGGFLHLEGPEVQPGLLARESEAEALADRVPQLTAEIAALDVAIAERVGARAEAAERIRRIEEEIVRLRREEAVVRARHEEVESRVRRLSESETTIELEASDVERSLSDGAERQSELDRRLAELEASHAASEARFDRLQAEVDRNRAEREAERAAGAGRRGQLDVLVERLRALDRDAARLGREIAAAHADGERWLEEERRLVARSGDLTTAMERSTVELQTALEDRAEVETRARAEEEIVDSERLLLRGEEQAIGELRQRHDAARAAVEELRIGLASAERDGTHLAAEISEQLHEAPPEVPGEPPADLAEREARLAELKTALEAFGPVNVLAAEEYGEQEERHGFLTTQRADVAKSVESLRQTIREINQTSGARFREAFALVNEQFGRTFQELFRGGEAEMRLMDEEDLLESGIEIVARPPGKRLQNLMLLSGGEKALTAIALLFALFRTKPSPFCILDEVDAPLDDVNTLRYVGMLTQLAKESQCIVITHNKLTMEVADTLYGVTMEERGVSKLIAVELESIQPAPAATA